MTEEVFPPHPMNDTAFYQTQKGPRTTLREGQKHMILDKAEADLILALRGASPVVREEAVGVIDLAMNGFAANQTTQDTCAPQATSLDLHGGEVQAHIRALDVKLHEIRNSLHQMAGRIGVLSFIASDTLPVEPGLNNGLDVIGHLASLNVIAEQIRDCVNVMEGAI
jgi:sensor histidine kinase regulating citrate/malate metabolism